MKRTILLLTLVLGLGADYRDCSNWLCDSDQECVMEGPWIGS